uniref:hypothetical protein n=1 Tax=Pseudonocardia sp. CA-138482 TaxID=3240023 RepID=UPI003F49756E
MTHTEINVPDLRKGLEHVTAHMDEWNQGAWAERSWCGTKCCLAGTVTLQAGADLDWGNREAFSLTTGQTIRSFAMQRLGLTEDQAFDLFNANNTLRRLWTLAREFSRGEIDVPDELPDES